MLHHLTSNKMSEKRLTVKKDGTEKKPIKGEKNMQGPVDASDVDIQMPEGPPPSARSPHRVRRLFQQDRLPAPPFMPSTSSDTPAWAKTWSPNLSLKISQCTNRRVATLH